MYFTLHTLGHQIAQTWFPNLPQGVCNYYYTNKACKGYSMGKGNHFEIASSTYGYPTLTHLNIFHASHVITYTQLTLVLSVSAQMPIVLYEFSWWFRGEKVHLPQKAYRPVKKFYQSLYQYTRKFTVVISIHIHKYKWMIIYRSTDDSKTLPSHRWLGSFIISCIL